MDAPDVLVVDDEPDVADTAAEILRTAGFAALTAYDVDSALGLAAEYSFKVFVLIIASDRTRANRFSRTPNICHRW